jgi:hypothetical protein
MTWRNRRNQSITSSSISATKAVLGWGGSCSNDTSLTFKDFDWDVHKKVKGKKILHAMDAMNLRQGKRRKSTSCFSIPRILG